MSAGDADFLGRGWSFPIRAVNIAKGEKIELSAHEEKGKKIELSAHEDKIREAIWIILATAKGERVMRPDFGAGVHDLVFGLSDSATAGRIADEVRDALVRWEPRIDVLDVTVDPMPDRASALLISIDYRVRATNNLFNLVYPFHLERGLA
jgi:phage baseplate assembly protein W